MDVPVSAAAQRQRRRRRWLVACVLVAIAAAVALGVSSLPPALPSIERTSVLLGTVERGAMVRQVRGSGSLLPEHIRFVQAESEGRVDRILVLPGAVVGPETVLLELDNPELEQAAFDAEWQLKAARAQLERVRAQLVSDELALRSALATLEAEAAQAEIEARASERLDEQKLISSVELQRARTRADGLLQRREIERRRLETTARSSGAQLSEQQAQLERARAFLARKREQVAALTVEAGVAGVVQQMGDSIPVEAGQRVTPGTTLAKIVEPARLKAVLRIPEMQAKDLQLGQPAEIDTRNGVVPGRVTRVDLAPRGGTVAVEVRLEGSLPRGARPDSSVDGVIELERLPSVLHVGRPVQAQPGSTVGLFKVMAGQAVAQRVPVQLGRSSVSVVEVVSGLQAGDQVILSDMTPWIDHERVRLR